MADRTSAALFGELFRRLAFEEPLDRLALARWLWDQTADYDFSPYQMCCDEALVKLGLVPDRQPPEGD